MEDAKSKRSNVVGSSNLKSLFQMLEIEPIFIFFPSAIHAAQIMRNTEGFDPL